MSTWSKADEQRHRPSAQRWWSETWCFEFQCLESSSRSSGDGGTAAVGGYVALTLLPDQRRAWYWAALVGPGRPLVALSDLHVPLGTRSLEIRSDGLWADHICEESLQRWTIGNEAFAVAFDDPETALTDARGTLTPLGFDLEWEASAQPCPMAAGDGYEIAAVVHGDVLVGSERLEVTALGRWWHRWGVQSWRPAELDGGPAIDGVDDDALAVLGVLRAPVRVEIDDDVVAIDASLGPRGWRSTLRLLSPLDDDGRTRWPPATS